MFWKATGENWEVVVEAGRKDVAMRRVRGHLERLGRVDLYVSDVSLVTIENGVVYHNVEPNLHDC